MAVLFCCAIFCPSQLRHKTIYRHKLLVYHLFMTCQLCLELVEDALWSETPLLYSIKCVAGNVACPLTHLCCYCGCLFPFRGWSIMALWKMGFIFHSVVWAIMWAPTGLSATIIHSQHTYSEHKRTVTTDHTAEDILTTYQNHKSCSCAVVTSYLQNKMFC